MKHVHTYTCFWCPQISINLSWQRTHMSRSNTHILITTLAFYMHNLNTRCMWNNTHFRSCPCPLDAHFIYKTKVIFSSYTRWTVASQWIIFRFIFGFILCFLLRFIFQIILLIILQFIFRFIFRSMSSFIFRFIFRFIFPFIDKIQNPFLFISRLFSHSSVPHRPLLGSTNRGKAAVETIPRIRQNRRGHRERWMENRLLVAPLSSLPIRCFKLHVWNQQ